MRTAKIVISCYLIFNAAMLSASAQNINNYVYKIIEKGMASKGSMTGFLYHYQEYTGIVTCLHGILPGKLYMAEGEVDGKSNLSLKFVDIDHDMAFLTSDYLSNQKEWIQAAGISLVEGRHLKVLGYPAGTAGLIDHSAVAGRQVNRQLKEMVPLDMIKFLTARKSPSLDINVLYIEGSMVPGHSGAPVLDENNKVYGVVDGGVYNGAANITWAIPIASIKWTDISNPGIADKITHLPLPTGKNESLYDFTSGESDTKAKPAPINAADLNGMWELTMVDAPSIKGDDTPLGGHWTVGGLLTLNFNDDHTVTGRFGSRSYVNCYEAEVSGKLEDDKLELVIACTKGSCLGSGFKITAKLIGKGFVGSNTLFPNRPEQCILNVSNQVTLEKQ